MQLSICLHHKIVDMCSRFKYLGVVRDKSVMIKAFAHILLPPSLPDLASHLRSRKPNMPSRFFFVSVVLSLILHDSVVR